MSDVQCVDLLSDRQVGDEWERNFCRLAAKYGNVFTAHQVGRTASARAWGWGRREFFGVILPDATIWSGGGEHHEIKHKDATRSGCFGLEKYRFDSLLKFRDIVKQPVYYTIHDYGQQPNDSREDRKFNGNNVAAHWLTSEVRDLSKAIHWQRPGATWIDGKKKCGVPILYWPREVFVSLVAIWEESRFAEIFP